MLWSVKSPGLLKTCPSLNIPPSLLQCTDIYHGRRMKLGGATSLAVIVFRYLDIWGNGDIWALCIYPPTRWMALITGGDLKGHFIITAYLYWITAAGVAEYGWGLERTVWSGTFAICKQAAAKSACAMRENCSVHKFRHTHSVQRLSWGTRQSKSWTPTNNNF